jgi:hypothetical protein
MKALVNIFSSIMLIILTAAALTAHHWIIGIGGCIACFIAGYHTIKTIMES